MSAVVRPFTTELFAQAEAFATLLKTDLADFSCLESTDDPLVPLALDLGLALNLAKLTADSPTGKSDASYTELRPYPAEHLKILQMLHFMKQMGILDIDSYRNAAQSAAAAA